MSRVKLLAVNASFRTMEQLESGPGHGKHGASGVVMPSPQVFRNHCACSTSVSLKSAYAGQYRENPKVSGIRHICHGLPLREHSRDTVVKSTFSSAGMVMLSSMMMESPSLFDPYKGMRITATRAADVSTSALRREERRILLLAASFSYDGDVNLFDGGACGGGGVVVLTTLSGLRGGEVP